MTDPNGTNIHMNSIGTGIFSSPAQMMAVINQAHDGDIDAIPNKDLPDSPGTVPVDDDDAESPGDGRRGKHDATPTADSVEMMFTDPDALELDQIHNDLEIINELSNPRMTSGGFGAPSQGSLKILDELSNPRVASVTLGRMPTEGGNV